MSFYQDFSLIVANVVLVLVRTLLVRLLGVPCVRILLQYPQLQYDDEEPEERILLQYPQLQYDDEEPEEKSEDRDEVDFFFLDALQYDDELEDKDDDDEANEDKELMVDTVDVSVGEHGE